MSIFIRQNITLHSGKPSDFKIECDGLSDEDINTLAFLIAKQITFGKVVGVPSGGLRLAEALKQYHTPSSENTLIADDVLTTGGSMEEMRKKVEGKSVGVVIFARGKCPSWIMPMFQMMEISNV